MQRTWLDAARDHAAAHGVASEVVEALRAFAAPEPRGGPPPPPERPWPGPFLTFAATLPDPAGWAPDIEATLGEEVDRAQAALFVRRLLSIDALLGERRDDLGALLRAGLRHRLASILREPHRRAVRVRALADFYWSVSARATWLGSAAPSIPQVAGTVEWRVVFPGVEHGLLDGPTDHGPVYINVLRIDSSRVEVVVVDARGRDGAGRDLAVVAREEGAIAGISAGYFLYSEPDIAPPERRHDPVGLLLSRGKVLSLPALRRSALLAGAGQVRIGPVGLAGLALEVGPLRLCPPLERIWTRAQALRGPECASIAIRADRVIAVGEGLDIPLTGCVITAQYVGEFDGIRAGAAVRCSPPLLDERPATDGVAGGPLLLAAGEPVIDLHAEDFWGTAPPVTFSQDETGDRNLLPRMAVGLDGAGRLICAAVDGRNAARALGLTLLELAELMAALGCVDAMNLDGGSSKRMVLDGEVLDLASTELVGGRSASWVRPVHTAILFRAR